MLQLLLAICLVTVSIFVHELGHFLVARWRGLVVPRFSIFGLGKPIVSWKWRGVEFCICWLPIGAYVMVPQLADLGGFEGEIPGEAKNLPSTTWSSKVLVAVAGPAANILFALVLACIVWFAGVTVQAEYNRTEVGDVAAQIQNSDHQTVPGPAAVAGLKPGDIIRQVDGKPVTNFSAILNGIVFGTGESANGHRMVEITFERNGQTLTRQVFPELVGSERMRSIGILPKSDLVIGAVTDGSPAAAAGLRVGDRILGVDGKSLTQREELREHFQKKSTAPSVLLFQRDGKELSASLQPRKQTIQGQTAYYIGVTWHIETTVIHPTPFEQIGDAMEQAYKVLSSLLNRKSDIGVRHISGIIGIVDNLQQAVSFGLIYALSFLIVINVSLAIANLLPIPVLDGGHVMFATWAKIRGKPVDPVWMQNAIAACLILLLSLIVYVSYNDIRRAIQAHWDSPPATEKPAK